jgi:hypothetical protein
MTSTISNTDTTTRDVSTYRTHPPVLRRPDATGELPLYRPVGVAELARLSAGETLVLPVDAVPSVPRHAAPTVYQPAQPEVVKPLFGRGRHRVMPVWPLLLAVAAGVLMIAAQAGLLVVAVTVSEVVR